MPELNETNVEQQRPIINAATQEERMERTNIGQTTKKPNQAAAETEHVVIRELDEGKK